MSAAHTVKETAVRVGLPARTLRYYDRIGLVCPPRSPAGYRIYGPEEEAKLAFVRRATALGLSLQQIGELLALADRDGAHAAREFERLLEARIATVDAQVAELATFRQRLVAFRSSPDRALGLYSAHGSLSTPLKDAPAPDERATAERGRPDALGSPPG